MALDRRALVPHPVLLLACLFQAIVIARSSLLLCKNFTVAHYSISIKCINTKLGILAHHDKIQLVGKGYNSESYIFSVKNIK